MNDKQRRKREELQRELYARGVIKEPLPYKGVSKEGFVFMEARGFTVIIGIKGGCQIPALRAYDNVLDAITHIDDEWKKQDTHPSTASHRDTGHFSPRIKTDWFCESDVCPCKKEPYGARYKRSKDRR